MSADIFEALGLDKNPFSMAADTEGYFHTDTTKQILDELAFGILSRKGFCLLTGEVGVGKTSLLYQLLRRLEAEDLVTSWIFNTMLNKEELLLAIAKDFGLDAPKTANVAQLIEILQHFLVQQNAAEKNCAIIVDEAHNLSLPALEALRMLSNLEAQGRKLVQILLVGQPELKARLDEPKLRQLRSRITIYKELAPFSMDETGRYVNFKLSSASSQFRLGKAPLKILFQATLGNTRMINLIMERALYATVAFGDKDLTPRAMNAAVSEIATCQVEVAERLACKARRRNSFLAAVGAAIVAALLLVPVLPGPQGSRSVAILAMDAILRKDAAPARDASGPGGVVQAPTGLEANGKTGTHSAQKSADDREKSRNSLTDNTNNETTGEQKREASEGKREYPQAYSDFLQAVGLERLLPQLGKAVEQKRLDLLEASIPRGLQLLQLDRLPAKAKVEYSAFPWKSHTDDNPAWVAIWKPALVVKDFYYGYRSEDILTLQKMLKRLGYYWGPDDGMVGPVTWRAINGFQKDMKLKRTMWPDPETIFWLVVMSRENNASAKQ